MRASKAENRGQQRTSKSLMMAGGEDQGEEKESPEGKNPKD